MQKPNKTFTTINPYSDAHKNLDDKFIDLDLLLAAKNE